MPYCSIKTIPIQKSSKYAVKKAHKEVSCTQSRNKWQMQDHNCFFFLRARSCLLLATPFLAQEEEILSITWLLKDLQLEPSLADGSEPLRIFMLSLGILSHKERRGRILAGCPLLHFISKGGCKSSSEMIVILLRCCQKSHNTFS